MDRIYGIHRIFCVEGGVSCANLVNAVNPVWMKLWAAGRARTGFTGLAELSLWSPFEVSILFILSK